LSRFYRRLAASLPEKILPSSQPRAEKQTPRNGGNLALPDSRVRSQGDLRFDAKQFRFSLSSQINDGRLFEQVMLKMFPPGTPQSYVEQILVLQGGAECSKQQIPRTDTSGAEYYNCHWPPRGIGGWVVVFVYDKFHKSIALAMNPMKPLYGVDPGWVYQRDVLQMHPEDPQR
jgi:hypothetical protein